MMINKTEKITSIFLKFKRQQQGIFQNFEVRGPLVAWGQLAFFYTTKRPWSSAPISTTATQGESVKQKSNVLSIVIQVVLHVFWRRHDVGGGLVVWRLVAGLAVQAAGEAAETVDVGPPGVVGYAPGLGVERVLLVDVVVLSVPGGRGSRKETDGVNESEAGKEGGGGRARVNTLQQRVVGGMEYGSG